MTVAVPADRSKQTVNKEVPLKVERSPCIEKLGGWETPQHHAPDCNSKIRDGRSTTTLVPPCHGIRLKLSSSIVNECGLETWLMSSGGEAGT